MGRGGSLFIGGGVGPQRFPKGRMSREQWQQLCQNARQDVRLNTVATEVRPDLKVPKAKVHAVKFELGNDAPVEFPDCEGTMECTLRTLLEYYLRTILKILEIKAGDRADISVGTATSDITSVSGSLVGAATGSLLLGPVGWVAGSYIGSKVGRSHSSAIAGGVAGAALFGPVGLLAGASLGASNQRPKMVEPRSVGSVQSSSALEGAVRAAGDHLSSKKYEYAGSTGVMVGAAAGAAVLGPVGLVAGAYLGSVSGRKAAEGVSLASAGAQVQRRGSGEDECGSGNGKPYRFGDLTRGVVARGKESRGASAKEGYKFGDFTRGLFGRK
uniref:Glycine zipper domain-containing protein n=1 Tax=Trieres chinensis TaxID=1514140 RepID=A0A7S1ZT12_TRICV|mmetsp:Transcript_32502/g.66447  ORF Transcript_32502/g.66447 Transcript_32502/m.66447 type:complete len:328 (+) Transcript_32502:556-1539(+)